MKKNKRKNKIKNYLIAFLIVIVVALIFKFLITDKNNKKENTSIDTQSVQKNDNSDENNSRTDVNEMNKKENDDNKELLERSSKQQSIKTERLNNGKILTENGLPVLMYHFFYDKSKGETAKDNNWIEISDFENQMKYLSENEFYFPTWQEVEDYIDGKIQLPEKSVVITVDDGDPSFFDLAVPIIQKYDVYATSFVIVYWYGDRADDKKANISYQSHSYDMHKGGSNGKGVILSWDYQKIKEDLEMSSEILGGANIFCYPFGHYNESSFKVLKDAGYKLAFTVEGGRVKKESEKYKLPRVRISGGISITSFAKKVE